MPHGDSRMVIHGYTHSLLTDTYLLPLLVLAFWRDAFVFAALASVFLIFNRTNFRLAGRTLKVMVLYLFIFSSIALRRTGVRIPPGPPDCTHPEPHSVPVEQFLAMLRFDNRDKLAELPIDLMESGRDDFF